MDKTLGENIPFVERASMFNVLRKLCIRVVHACHQARSSHPATLGRFCSNLESAAGQTFLFLGSPIGISEALPACLAPSNIQAFGRSVHRWGSFCGPVLQLHLVPWCPWRPAPKIACHHPCLATPLCVSPSEVRACFTTSTILFLLRRRRAPCP